MRIRFEDSDGDGFLDTWKVDADGDGAFERITRVADPRVKSVDFNYRSICRAQRAALEHAQSANERMMALLRKSLPGWTSPIERYWDAEMPTSYYASAKIHASQEGRRYYADIIRESFYAELRSRAATAIAAGLDQAYLVDDVDEMARLLAETPGPTAKEASASACPSVSEAESF